MSTFKRSDRIAGMMQRKLATLIQQEVKDPRLPSFLTISSVNVSADLGHAKVYFTVFDADIEATAAVLNSSASFLRSALARTMTIRTIPALHFVYDESIEYGRKLSKIIQDLDITDSDSDADKDKGKDKPTDIKRLMVEDEASAEATAKHTDESAITEPTNTDGHESH